MTKPSTVGPGAASLRASLRRLGSSRVPSAPGAPGQDPGPKLSLEPSSAFEVAIAEQIRALRDDVDELKDRLNWLFGLIIAAAVANVILALLS